MKSNFKCVCLESWHALNILMHCECNTVMICCRIVGKVFVTFCSLLLVMIINALCQSWCCMLCCCHLLMLIWICWCSWYCHVDIVMLMLFSTSLLLLIHRCIVMSLLLLLWMALLDPCLILKGELYWEKERQIDR